METLAITENIYRIKRLYSPRNIGIVGGNNISFSTRFRLAHCIAARLKIPVVSPSLMSSQRCWKIKEKAHIHCELMPDCPILDNYELKIGVGKYAEGICDYLLFTEWEGQFPALIDYLKAYFPLIPKRNEDIFPIAFITTVKLDENVNMADEIVDAAEDAVSQAGFACVRNMDEELVNCCLLLWRDDTPQEIIGEILFSYISYGKPVFTAKEINIYSPAAFISDSISDATRKMRNFFLL